MKNKKENKEERNYLSEIEKIINDFMQNVDDLNQKIIKEKNMKQKFLLIGKKQSYNECIQILSTMIY